MYSACVGMTWTHLPITPRTFAMYSAIFSSV